LYEKLYKSCVILRDHYIDDENVLEISKLISFSLMECYIFCATIRKYV